MLLHRCRGHGRGLDSHAKDRSAGRRMGETQVSMAVVNLEKFGRRMEPRPCHRRGCASSPPHRPPTRQTSRSTFPSHVPTTPQQPCVSHSLRREGPRHVVVRTVAITGVTSAVVVAFELSRSWSFFDDLAYPKRNWLRSISAIAKGKSFPSNLPFRLEKSTGSAQSNHPLQPKRPRRRKGTTCRGGFVSGK